MGRVRGSRKEALERKDIKLLKRIVTYSRVQEKTAQDSEAPADLRDRKAPEEKAGRGMGLVRQKTLERSAGATTRGEEG